MENKSINSQIEEMKKGCGTDFSSGNMPICICGAKEDKYTKLYGKYCPSCQAKLSTLQEAQKMFLEEIDKKLSDIDYSLDNLDNNEEFQDMEEYERDEYLNNLYGMRQGLEELKSRIGRENDWISYKQRPEWCMD